MLVRKGAAGCPRAGLGSGSGDPFTFWRPLTLPWRGPDVICGALVRCSFPAPTPPETEREHGFFDAFEGIRVRPKGNACSGARRLTFHVPRGLTRRRGLPMPGHGELFSEGVLWPTPKAGSGPPVLGGRRGLQKWQPSHAFDASGAALARP